MTADLIHLGFLPPDALTALQAVGLARRAAAGRDFQAHVAAELTRQSETLEALLNGLVGVLRGRP